MSCRREGLVCLRKGSGGGVKVPWLHDRRSRVDWEGRLMQTVSVCPPIRVSLGGLNCIERWMIIPRSEATQALHEPVRRKSLAAWRRPGSGGVRGTNSRRTLGPSTAIANLTQHGASDRSMPHHRCLRSYNIARHCVSRRRHVRDRCEWLWGVGVGVDVRSGAVSPEWVEPGGPKGEGKEEFRRPPLVSIQPSCSALNSQRVTHQPL